MESWQAGYPHSAYRVRTPQGWQNPGGLACPHGLPSRLQLETRHVFLLGHASAHTKSDGPGRLKGPGSCEGK